MKNDEEDVMLKNENGDWVVLEEEDVQQPTGKPVKVYKTIAGLTNIGKTFFTTGDEIEAKRKVADAQMAQKYGAEIYGISSQLSGQRSGGTASGTGTSSVSKSGLITCSVSRLMNLGNLKKESIFGGDSFDDFTDSLKDVWKMLEQKSKDENWVKEHGNWTEFGKICKAFHKGSGPKDKTNIESWKKITEFFKKEPWKSDFKKDKELKTACDKMVKNWNKWTDGTANSSDEKEESLLGGSAVSGSDWNPYQTWRIDIKTDFGEDWFKRKFKSGLLNRVIMGVRNTMRDQLSDAAKAHLPKSSTEHLSPDEMTAADKRKLDGIQWKMTNKVAKDYVSMLLGYSRKKEMYQEAPGEYKPTEELKEDSGFGKQMAKKALGGRGILGRLKQKIFSGGQSNNVISIAFMVADYNDGWTVVEKKDDKIGDIPSDGSKGVESEAEPVSESMEGFDPFADVFVEGEDFSMPLEGSPRHQILESVCHGDADSVDKLVENCLVGKVYN